MEAKNYNFVREKCIGRGSFGKVYLCFDKNERQKKFAMKVIDLEGLTQDERNMTKEETKLLTTLQHKYILHAVTTYQENETLCIVTEFCDQGDLNQFLQKRKGNLLEEERIVEWFWQICSALEYLHKKNVLHRDIKPHNIFLTGKEMTAKLGDLGLAKVLESSIQKASTFCGTPYYLSPEIVACKPYNSKSDIWAMGVCVHEMTTLRRPFDARLEQQLYLKIANDQLPPIPKDKYSPQLIKVIERMLCRETDYRPTATELLQDDLFKNQQTSKCKIKQNRDSAAHVLQKFLESLKVCERDALEVEKKICKMSTESYTVRKVDNIPSHKISTFLDDLQKSGGIDNTLRRKLDGINYCSECLYGSFDSKFDTSFSNLHGRFDGVVLWKSEDGGYMQFINVMYKIESETIPEWSKKLWYNKLNNFIRTKALHKFLKEGLITFINVDPN